MFEHKISEVEVLYSNAKTVETIESAQGDAGSYEKKLDSIDSLLVRVTTTDGEVGYGECLCTGVGGALGTSYSSVINSIVGDLLSPLITGKNFQNASFYRDFTKITGRFGHMGWLLEALSGIDIALWDLKGKFTGQSISEMIYSKKRDKVKAYVSKIPGLRHLEEEEINRISMKIKEMTKIGFRDLKLSGGYGVKADTESIIAAYDCAPTGTNFMIDIGEAYNLSTATLFSNNVNKFGLSWIEAPFPLTCVNCYSKFGKITNIPVGLDPIPLVEYIPDFVLKGGAYVGIVNLVRDGGITNALRYHQLADIFGFQLSLGCAWTITSVGLAAMVQVAASIEAINLIETRAQFNHNPLGNLILNEPIRIENGHVIVPDGPGLGIKINEKKLEKYVDQKAVF